VPVLMRYRIIHEERGWKKEDRFTAGIFPFWGHMTPRKQIKTC
jgi:hypothetical protein